MKKTRKGYKNTMQDLVHKVGGAFIDKMEISLDNWPIWFTEFAESFNKKPHDVAKDMICYRNSMGYEYRRKGIK